MKKVGVLFLFLSIVGLVQGQNLYCQYCEYAVTLAEFYIATYGTPNNTAVVQLFEQFCQLLGPLEAECEDFAKNELPQILTALEQDQDADKVCAMLGLCSNSTTISQSVKVPIKITDKKAPKDALPCTLCTYTVYLTELYINATGANETQILNDLLLFCTYLPEQFQAECKAFVYITAPTIIEELINGADPRTVCVNLDLCPNSTAYNPLHFPYVPVGRGKGKGKCSSCLWGSFVVQSAKQNLGSRFTNSVALERLQNTCRIFSRKKEKCAKMMAIHGLEIIDASLKYDQPIKACRSLDLCFKH